MKYLVNRETKEHQIASEIAASSMERYPGFAQDWKLVEADAGGWIPWNGGECPLPRDAKCVVKDRHTLTRGCGEEFSWCHEESNARGSEWNILAYRPILAEKEECSGYVDLDDVTASINNGIRRRMDETKLSVCGIRPASSENITESECSVFDRLRQATEAAESIPAILAEINALLPDGYCVFHCGSQSAKDRV